MQVSDVIARLKDQVPDLGGRISAASELRRLTSTGGEPQATPAAFVVPSGIVGGTHSGQVGGYVQPVERLYSVLLVYRSDQAGLRALETAEEMIWSIVDAMTGWDGASPGGEGLTGLFTLKRVQLVQIFPGALSWELTFGILDRIRKVTPS